MARKHIVKRNLILATLSRLLVIFFLFLGCSFANTNLLMDPKIQELVSEFREKSKAPAAVLSVNFSGNRILNYVSGTVIRVSPKNLHPHRVTTDNLFQIGMRLPRKVSNS